MFRQYFPAGFDAGPIRKADIHQDHIRPKTLRFFRRLGLGVRFSHDRDALIIVQNGSQPDANHFMVVD